MSIEAEQSRIDFEAYVSSITGSQKPLISMHWTGQGYSEASGLEPFWRCWAAAQIASSLNQPQRVRDPAIRLELVRYLTDGLHIRKWENLGGLPPGIHTLYSEPVQHHGDPVTPLALNTICDRGNKLRAQGDHQKFSKQRQADGNARRIGEKQQ